jgi:hypothetical protein
MEEQDPKERLYNFIPNKYSSLRHIPGDYIYIYNTYLESSNEVNIYIYFIIT